MANQGRSWRGVPPAERHARRRQRLLDAGLEVFGTSGYPSATVTGICREAGVSTRSFYEHFQSRDDLLVAVYRDIELEIAALTTSLDLDLRDADLPTWMVRVLGTVLGPLLDDERKARITQVEIVGVSPSVENIRRSTITEVLAQIEAVVRAFVGSQGETPEHDPRLLAQFMVGGVTQMLAVRLQTPASQRCRREDFLANIAGLLLQLLAPAPHPHPRAEPAADGSVPGQAPSGR